GSSIFAGTDAQGVWVRPLSEVGVRQISSEIPVTIELHQNYPNPFNPSTKIKFEIPSFGEVLLEIYDADGRLCKTLVKGKYQAGIYETEFDAAGYSSGVYFSKLVFGGKQTGIRKMVFIK
ncbi:MAG: T9SS type A sorting domain-containing protein, partial [Bacteroidetes bacterium]|nr:T9SS type A sorting domain-containing protein [Bacteroidota bacterium]